jgi:hypothetical protein
VVGRPASGGCQGCWEKEEQREPGGEEHD